MNAPIYFSDWEIECIEHRIRRGLDVPPDVLRDASEQILVRGLDQTAQLRLELADAESLQEEVGELETDLEDLRVEHCDLENERDALKARIADLEALASAPKVPEVQHAS